MAAQVLTWETDRNGKIVEVKMQSLDDLILVAGGRTLCLYGNKHFFIDANGVMYSFQ